MYIEKTFFLPRNLWRYQQVVRFQSRKKVFCFLLFGRHNHNIYLRILYIKHNILAIEFYDNFYTGTITLTMKDNEILELLMSPADAAQELGFTSQYVTYLCKKGEMSARKIGQSWVITRPGLDDFKAQDRPQRGKYDRVAAGIKKPILSESVRNIVDLAMRAEKENIDLTKLIEDEISKRDKDT